MKAACFLCHDVFITMNGKVVFKGFKKPLYEVLPDIFYCEGLSDLEMAVWDEHAKALMKDN